MEEKKPRREGQQMQIHVVQPGESIYTIARRYRVPAKQIIIDNELAQPDRLAVGQTLVILFPEQVHIAEPGETLPSIAQRFGVPVRQLLRNNPTLYRSVRPGQAVVLQYPPPPFGPIAVNGYAYPFINRDILYKTLPFLTYLTLFGCHANADGSLKNMDDAELIAAAHAYGTAPLMLISNLDCQDRFNSELAHQILNSPEARERLVEQTYRRALEMGYAGIDVDFEYILEEDAEAYASLMRELSAKLNPAGLVVFTALAPKTSSDQKGVLYAGHDYASLGQAANGVMIMTYEWGYSTGMPMAIAPLDSVRRVMDYSVTQIEPAKLLMGIPNYGYDWTLPYIYGQSRAPSISNTAAVQLAVDRGAVIRYDPKAQSPWFRYWDVSGREHEVWFEDARSITAKLALAHSYPLLGVSYWNIMRYFPQNWLVLNALFHIRSGVD